MRTVRRLALGAIVIVLSLVIATCAALMTRDEASSCVLSTDLDQPINKEDIARISLSSSGLRVKGVLISSEQATNAHVIVSVAADEGLTVRAAVVATMTAMQEAALRSLLYGYPGSTSLGMYQQISAWGTVSERTDPRTSTEMFFNGGRGGQSGLTDIKGWEKLALGDAAQAVQRSGFPRAYDQHEHEARAIVGAVLRRDVSGDASQGCDSPDSIETMVEFALLNVGTEYEWQDKSGAAFVSAMAGMADVTLPSEITQLMKYEGSKTEGVTVKVIEGGGVATRDSLQRGDIIIASSKPGGKPSRAYIELGTEGAVDQAQDLDESTYVVGKFGGRVDSRPLALSKIVRVLRLTVAVSGGKWVFPMKKGTYSFRVNSYGPRFLNGDDYHNGSDFGTGGAEVPLVAMHDGTVIRSGYAGAWGNYLIVETGVPVKGMANATYKYLYAHLSRYEAGVRAGTRVKAGQRVGNVGNTGNSFGEHLHLTICTSMTCTSGNANGSVDPIPFLKSVGVTP